MKKNILIYILLAILLSAMLSIAGENIEINVNGGELFGTLELPSEQTPCPVVLIIAGSGPTDRDGNNPIAKGKNNSLKLLAESLAVNGIASVRYDKRGIGASAKSMTKEQDLRFETYIDDAVQWIMKLQSDSRFSSLSVIGHSEGSLIGMIACQEFEADAFISIAGPGVPVSDILLTQLKSQLPQNLYIDAESIIDQLNHGTQIDSIPPGLKTLFRQSVQPYMISWFKYDPAFELAKLKIPVLILQGTRDLQVYTDNGEALFKSNSKVKLKIIEGMDHHLKIISGTLFDQLASNGTPDAPVSKDLIIEIVEFVVSAAVK